VGRGGGDVRNRKRAASDSLFEISLIKNREEYAPFEEKKHRKELGGMSEGLVRGGKSANRRTTGRKRQFSNCAEEPGKKSFLPGKEEG